MNSSTQRITTPKELSDNILIDHSNPQTVNYSRQCYSTLTNLSNLVSLQIPTPSSCSFSPYHHPQPPSPVPPAPLLPTSNPPSHLFPLYLSTLSQCQQYLSPNPQSSLLPRIIEDNIAISPNGTGQGKTALGKILLNDGVFVLGYAKYVSEKMGGEGLRGRLVGWFLGRVRWNRERYLEELYKEIMDGEGQEGQQEESKEEQKELQSPIPQRSEQYKIASPSSPQISPK